MSTDRRSFAADADPLVVTVPARRERDAAAARAGQVGLGRKRELALKLLLRVVFLDESVRRNNILQITVQKNTWRKE